MSSAPAAAEKQTPCGKSSSWSPRPQHLATVLCDYHPYQSHSWIQLHEVVVEKEYQLECSNDELQRLSICEAENKRKDGVIMTLRKEITEYKKCTQNRDIRYASVEGRLQSSESHLQDKIKEVQKLQSELEKAHEKLRSTTSKSATVQKELSQLSHTNAQQCQELKELRKQRKCDTDTIAALRAEVAEKKRNLERVKKIRSENQELQKRLECLQANQEAMLTSENQLKAEMAKLKNLSSNGELLQAKYDFSEQELMKAKDRENAMAVEMGKLESELSMVCSHVLACFQVPRTEEEASPQVAIQVITQFADSCLKVEEKLALCEEDLEKHEEGQDSLNNSILQLCKLWKEFQEGVKVDVVGALNLLADGLQKSGSEDGNLNELLDMMAESASSLYSLTEQGQGQLSSLRDHITSSFRALPEHNATELEESDVSVMVTSMASSLQSSTLQISKLKQQLLEADQEHTASLLGATSALREEESKRIQDAVEKTRQEERERLCKELESAKEVLVLEKQEAVLQEQEAVASLRKELEAVRLSVTTEAEESVALHAELDDMRTKLATAELGKSEAISAAGGYKETLDEQCTEKISGFKEQAQQYAFTIVAMEGKLLKMLEKTTAMQSENQSLQEQLDSVTTTSAKGADSQREKIHKLDELVRVLRNQLRLASEGISQRETAIKQLESNLLAQGQKAEESRAQLKHEHFAEVSDFQLTMAKQEAVMECQKTELDILAGNLREKTSDLEETKQECVKMAEELSVIQKEVAAINDMDDKQRQFLLTEAGHVCLGEKHNDVISNQKTAIAQLREKLTELELAKPPIGSHQATLKELSRVRHELLKVKSDAQRFKADEKNAVVTTQSQSTPRPQFAFMEGNKSQEAALQQLEETFQCSERMYKNLVEAICKGMPDLTRYPLEDADQLVPTDEQTKKKMLVKDRKKFADTVCRKLTHQMKLQAELKASSRSDASKSVHEDGSGMEEEVEEKTPEEVIKELECALSATAEELEQQRRLNQSLIRRKNFKETQLLASQQKPRHKCTAVSN